MNSFHILIFTCAALILISITILYQVIVSKRILFQAILRLQRRTWDNLALIASGQTDDIPLPYHGDWRTSPDFLNAIIWHARNVKPGVVVELGSGVSTYWLARTIRANGKGCLFSIDHDEGFMAETKSHLEAVNLEKEVNFRLAPLTEGPTWYTQLLLNDINGIDLLVVDGPPIVLGADRGFALTYFADRLNDGATVFFDDTGRVADRESIRRAQRLDDRFDLDFIDSEKGYCVAHFARGGHAKGTFDGSNEK